MIDHCVFVDDDKQAYLIYGGGNICQGGKIKDNMIEIEGKIQDMNGLQDLYKAAWLFKRKGIDYLTYADNNRHENQLQSHIAFITLYNNMKVKNRMMKAEKPGKQ